MPKVFKALTQAVRDIREIYSGASPRQSSPNRIGAVPQNIQNMFSIYGHSLSWHSALSEYLLMPRVTPVLEGALILGSQLVPPRVYVKRFKDFSRSKGLQRYLESLIYYWTEEGYNLSDLIRYLLQTGNIFLVRSRGHDSLIDLWRMIPPMYVKIVYVVEDEESRSKFLRAYKEMNKDNPSSMTSLPTPVPVFKRYVIQYSEDRVAGPIFMTGTFSAVMDYKVFDRSVFGYSGSAAELLTMDELNKIEEKFEVYSPQDVVHIRWVVDLFDPYGTSIFEPIRFTWKQYVIMVQALIIWRLTNVVQRDVIFYPIGDKPLLDAKQEIEELKEYLFGDWMSWGDEVLRSGNIKGFMSPIIIPYSSDRKPDINPGEGPPQRFREIADVEHFMYELLAGIGMADIVSKGSGAQMQFLSLSDIAAGRSPTLVSIASRIQHKVQEMFMKIIQKTNMGLELLGSGSVVKVKTIFEYEGVPPTSHGVFIDEKFEEEPQGEGPPGIGGGIAIGGIPTPGGEEEETISPPPAPSEEETTPPAEETSPR